MSKFCFVILDSLIRVPYIDNYIANMDQPYDVVIWDRSNTGNTCGAEHFYAMEQYSTKRNGIFGKITKAANYLKFSGFVTRILNKNNYDGVIVFAANTAWLINKVLLTKYKNRYLFDIRDYWQEKHKWFFNIEERIVKNAYANVISSDAYRRFLPEAEYTLCHNLQLFNNKPEPHHEKSPLVISCIGGVKFIEYDKKVIDYFANDERFFLRFIGRGYEDLTEYIKEQGYTNIYAEGMFPSYQTMEKYNGTDLILNMYGNNNPKLDYALSNKLYISAQFNLPILVCPKTYMEEVVLQNGLGFSIDIADPAAKDKLFDSYNKMDKEKYNQDCAAFIASCCDDNRKFDELCKRFIGDMS